MTNLLTNCDKVLCVKENTKQLRNFHVPKKGKSADKVSCLKK